MFAYEPFHCQYYYPSKELSPSEYDEWETSKICLTFNSDDTVCSKFSLYYEQTLFKLQKNTVRYLFSNEHLSENVCYIFVFSMCVRTTET